MESKRNVEEVFSSDVYYVLFSGGYLNPATLLARGEDIERVVEAIETVEEYIAALQGEGILIEL